MNRGLLFLMAIMLLSSCDPNQRTAYEQEIYELRREKDKTFKFEQESPLSRNQKLAFTELDYFAVDEEYKVIAKLDRIETSEFFEMTYTNGKKKMYQPYAMLRFKLKGREQTLTAYQNIELLQNPRYQNNLFMPFTDPTNGESTYKSGRYLDLTIPEGDSMVLDFNLAYNPYCAYNENYTCPVPPQENNVTVPVHAGERNY